MKKKVLTKAQINRLHFKRRLQERYGLVVNRKQIEEMVELYKSGNGKYIVKRLSLSRTLIELPYLDVNIYAIYDHNNYCFITCYKPEWVTRWLEEKLPKARRLLEENE